MAWPTALEVGARARVDLTKNADGDYVTAYDVNVSGLVSDALATVAEFCRRDSVLKFDEGTVEETFDERYVLTVKHPPVVSVSSVVVDDSTLDEDDYKVYWNRVELIRDTTIALMSTEPTIADLQSITLTYVGGFSDAGTGHIAIPRALSDIVREMAVRMLLRIDEQYRINRGVRRLDIGGSAETFLAHDVLFADLYRRLAVSDWMVRGY